MTDEEGPTITNNPLYQNVNIRLVYYNGCGYVCFGVLSNMEIQFRFYYHSNTMETRMYHGSGWESWRGI